MSAKPGRNDPCHCGSGKKYKHCHLAADSAINGANGNGKVAETHSAPPQTPAESLDETVRTLQGLLGTKARKHPEEIARMLARAELLKAYLRRESEIQSATQALESRQKEFAEFAHDATAFQDRVETLFAEDRFVCCRFTIDALQRAFDHFGSPLTIPKEKLKEHMRAVILHLADKDYRTSASINLLLSLPDYVAAERFIDGCLVMSCARMTLEVAQADNPFLWQMLVHGYQAWTAAKQARLGG
jgi:hypothetical protein